MQGSLLSAAAAALFALTAVPGGTVAAQPQQGAGPARTARCAGERPPKARKAVPRQQQAPLQVLKARKPTHRLRHPPAPTVPANAPDFV